MENLVGPWPFCISVSSHRCSTNASHGILRRKQCCVRELTQLFTSSIAIRHAKLNEDLANTTGFTWWIIVLSSKQHLTWFQAIKKVDHFLFPLQLQICHGNPNHLHRLMFLYQSCPQTTSTIQADYLPSQRSSFSTISCWCWWHSYAPQLPCLQYLEESILSVFSHSDFSKIK